MPSRWWAKNACWWREILNIDSSSDDNLHQSRLYKLKWEISTNFVSIKNSFRHKNKKVFNIVSIDKRSNRRCSEERGNIFIYIKKDDNVDNDCGRRKNDNKKKRASIIKKYQSWMCLKKDVNSFVKKKNLESEIKLLF